MTSCCVPSDRWWIWATPLIVVEHDEDTMRAADYIVDAGPGAGIHGGEIVAAGSLRGHHRLPPLHHRAISLRCKEDSRPA